MVAPWSCRGNNILGGIYGQLMKNIPGGLRLMAYSVLNLELVFERSIMQWIMHWEHYHLRPQPRIAVLGCCSAIRPGVGISASICTLRNYPYYQLHGYATMSQQSIHRSRGYVRTSPILEVTKSQSAARCAQAGLIADAWRLADAILLDLTRRVLAYFLHASPVRRLDDAWWTQTVDRAAHCGVSVRTEYSIRKRALIPSMEVCTV